MTVRLAGALLVAVLVSPVARADAVLTPKHLIIVRPGLDAVFGSYVFAVHNASDAPVHFASRVMLPKETDDFVPQEGVEPNELTLGQNGGVVIEKDFPKGVHIVSIGFKVSGSYGRSSLTFTPVSDIQSLTVLVPRATGIAVSSAILTSGESGAAPDPQYEAYVNSAPLTTGASFVIDVAGLPEGRTRIWIVGGVVAGLLAVLAGFLAWRTRPKITGDAGQSVLTS